MHDCYKLQWITFNPNGQDQFHVIEGCKLETMQLIFDLLPIETTTDAQIWDMSVDPPQRIDE